MYIPTVPLPVRAAPAQALGAVVPASPVDGAEHPLERGLLAALAGRTVSALVVGRADDGHGIVDIGGTRLTVAADLPAPGTQVTLRFSGTTAGTPTLASANAALAASIARAGAPLTAGSADGGKTGGVLVQLGEGARSLGRFADTPLTPLPLGQVDAPIESPNQWSAALARLLRDSGTFYESHLAAWTRGRYALDDIRREPQAAAGASQAASAQGDAQAGVHLRALPPLPAQDGGAPAREASNVILLPAAASSAGGVPEPLQPVLREQLHALETQSLPLSVEPWLGQRADLVIEREPEEQARGTQDVPGWKTRLNLTLPALGRVEASITLKGDRLWLDLSAPAGSTPELDGAEQALAQAMHSAGLRLVRTRIHESEGSATADAGATATTMEPAHGPA
jgi:hypothetical protein